MYAVIESGGKQYRVQPGDVVQVEKLENEEGSALAIDQVLFISQGTQESPEIILGKPYVSGASVTTEVVGQGRGEKILIMKMKRRKQYRRTQGHRQYYTQLLVTEVNNGAGKVEALSTEEKKAKLAQFQSHLKPKGEAMTPKTLGSRERMKRAKAEQSVASA